MRKKIKEFLRIYLALTITKSIGFTLKFEIVGEEHRLKAENLGKGIIYSLWHGNLLFIGYFIYSLKNKRKGYILSSPSRDGEAISKVGQGLRFGRVMGAAKRGGVAAIIELANVIKNGNDALITPDGPRGPRHILQPGVIHLAKKSGAPILPIVLGAKKAKIFNSWDRFVLPFPFSKTVIIYGEPMSVPANSGPAELKILREALEKEMRRIAECASTYFN